MANYSDAIEAALLAWEKGTTFPAAPGTVYAALFSADPTEAGLLTNEVTTTIRTAGRVPIVFGAVTNTASTPASMSNSADVDFGLAAAGATVTHVATFTTLTGNTLMIRVMPLATPKTVVAGAPVKFAVGAFAETVD